jgi:hypothetical protein
MSDGPHRCLPLRRNWQKVAECADKGAFALDDMVAALIPALAQDWEREVPPGLMSGLSQCLESGGQQSLLYDSRSIEALRPLTSGVSLGGLIVDYAVQAVSEAKRGIDAMQHAVERALTEWANRIGWQIEEHYCRKSNNRRAYNVRTRIEAAISKSPITDLATQIVKGGLKSVSKKVRKRSGIDEGPSL